MKNNVTLAAHRGWRAKYPENTMRGFLEALKLDIDAIEMDVHMTKDYHIVVCHDASLDRTTDTTGKICHMTLDEVRAADAGIKFGEEFRGERVPTFEEFLQLMSTRPEIRLLLELKDYPEEIGDFAYASATKTLEMCREYGIFGRERLTVITFSTGICAWLRARYNKEDFYIHGFYPKTVMKGWEKDDPYKYYDEVCLFSSGAKDPQGFPIKSLSPVVDKARFDEFKLMGIKPCIYYKLNTDEEAYRQALANGAIGVTSDNPDICGEILDRLGARKLKK
jgi:glycerophosphoryl diester phosphodiesterase